METTSLSQIFGENQEAARKQLLKLVDYRMPFGKYEGRRLIELPEPYVVWFYNKGFPEGELGRLLAIVYEIKANGLEPLLTPLINRPSSG